MPSLNCHQSRSSFDGDATDEVQRCPRDIQIQGASKVSNNSSNNAFQPEEDDGIVEERRRSSEILMDKLNVMISSCISNTLKRSATAGRLDSLECVNECIALQAAKRKRMQFPFGNLSLTASTLNFNSSRSVDTGLSHFC